MTDQGMVEMIADEAPQGMDTVKWVRSTLFAPTLGQLLSSEFGERQHLLYPWLREEESCMVYAGTGVGKSLFALSVAIVVAGQGEFLGWQTNEKTSKEEEGWKVLYVDGEMHIGDIQERAKTLVQAIPGIDKRKAKTNLRFLSRQHQSPGTRFPLITDPDGMGFILERVKTGNLDLVILDNFTTLGEVEDENSASSFNAIQQFLLDLKAQKVATILVHHAGKSGTFRGSSKLAATFETIIELKAMEDKTEHGQAQFRVQWEKVRSGGPSKTVRDVIAALVEDKDKPGRQVWEYEEAALARLDDMKDRMKKYEFTTRREMGDFYNVSPMTITNHVRKGIELGMWTDHQVSQWLATGKQHRTLGKTLAPVRATEDWQSDAEFVADF